MRKFRNRKKPEQHIQGYSFDRREAQIVLPLDSTLKREDVVKAIEEERKQLHRGAKP